MPAGLSLFCPITLWSEARLVSQQGTWTGLDPLRGYPLGRLILSFPSDHAELQNRPHFPHAQVA